MSVLRTLKKWNMPLKLCVMVFLLACLYRNVNFEDFGRVLRGMTWQWLPLVYALLLTNTILNSWKWGLLLAGDGNRIRLPSLMCSHLIGTFFNLFLPSSIGGDAYRVVDVGRRIGASAKSFASVFAERLVGFLALALWGLLFSVIGFSRLPDKRILFLPILVFGIMVCMVLLVIQRRLLVWGFNWVRLNKIQALDRFLHTFLDSIAGYCANRVLMWKVFVLSLVFQMLSITTIFILSQTLHWHVPFVYFCIFVPLITLAEAVPISIFGIGVRDGCYVFFFAQAGVPREEALALALVYLMTTLVYSLVGGILFLVRRHSTGGCEPPVGGASVQN